MVYRLPSLALLCALGLSPAKAEIFDCVLDPAVTVALGGATQGLIETVLVERGDHVSEGQTVARLVSQVESETVTLLRIRDEDESVVAAQRARLRLARERLERTQRLAERGVATADALDEIEAEVEVARNLLAEAELSRRVVGQELRRAEASLARLEIRSPIDGVVTDRALYAGEFLRQEGHVVTIARLDPLHVETFLPAALFGAVAVGDVAHVRPAPPIEGERAARVTVIDRVFDAASGTFGVRLALPNPDGAVPAGHRCEVRFDLATRETQ
jgi:RND family efflux transporter MFP subunit